MEKITIHPKDEGQLQIVIDFLNSKGVPFKKTRVVKSYDPEFAKEILQVKKDFEKGTGIVMFPNKKSVKSKPQKPRPPRKD